MKYLFILIVIFCTTFTTNAQEDQELKSLKEKGLLLNGGGKATSRITIENKGKVVLVNESVQEGDSITVTVAWANRIEKILLEGEYAYKPTPEEIKKGIYTFRFKPKRTFSFKVSMYYKDRKPTTWIRVVKVLDKNGQEIKGVDPTEMPRRSNN